MPDVILPTREDTTSLASALERMPGGFDCILVGSGAGIRTVAAAFGARIVDASGRDGAYAAVLCARTPVVCVMACDGRHDPRHLPVLAIPVLDGEADLALGVYGGAEDLRGDHVSMFAARREPLLELAAAHETGWLQAPATHATQAGLRVCAFALDAVASGAL